MIPVAPPGNRADVPGYNLLETDSKGHLLEAVVKSKAWWTLFPLIVLLLLPAGCSRQKDAIVLKVNDDWTLTAKQFRSMVIGRYRTPEEAAQQTEETLKSYLDDLLVRRLKVEDALHKGFDTRPEIVKAYNDALRRAAVSELYRDVILKPLIPEKEIREYYDRDKEEVHASHILIKVDRDTNNDQAKAKLEEIRKELAKGADFTQLARKYSEDSTTPNGDLGWFRWGVMVDPFQRAAFSLKPGEVSQPVKTQYGWHLIKLHDKKLRSDIKPFEEAREEILNRIARTRSSELREAAIAYYRKQAEKRGVIYHEDAMETIFNAMRGRVKSGNPFSLLTEEQQSLPLAELPADSAVITAVDIRSKYFPMRRANQKLDSVDKIREMVDAVLAENYIFPDEAREKGYYENPVVLEQAEKAREARLYQAVQQELILSRANPTDEEALAFYREHPDKYMTEAQYTLVEILVSDRKLADELVERIKGGENMRALAVQYSERPDAKKKMGVFGPIRKTQHGAIGRKAAKSPIGKIVGPVKYGKKWSIFKVISKEEPRVRDFEKVKTRVITDARMEKRRKIDEAYTDSLRQAIPNKMNTRPLATLFADVQVEKKKGGAAPPPQRDEPHEK